MTDTDDMTDLSDDAWEDLRLLALAARWETVPDDHPDADVKRANAVSLRTAVDIRRRRRTGLLKG